MLLDVVLHNFASINLMPLICSENTPAVCIHVHIRLDLMMEANTMALIRLLTKELSELG